jgi:hypothetical protein
MPIGPRDVSSHRGLIITLKIIRILELFQSLSEYYSVGNIDDFLHVELLCNDQVFFEILKMKIRSVSINVIINPR